MMKRASSNLIDAFLHNVQSGCVEGKADTSGPEILRQISAALEEILGGASPDVALRIERSRGKPADEQSWTLACIMRAHEKAGHSKPWCHANDWLERNGRSPLSERRLRQIRQQYQHQIQLSESIALMIEKTRAATEAAKSE